MDFGVSKVEHCLTDGLQRGTDVRQTPNVDTAPMGVRRREISSVAERETAQISV